MHKTREAIDAQQAFMIEKSKPISFDDEMVPAIIQGRKKMTRRILPFCGETKCRYGYSGDFLYVKEIYFDARPFKNTPLFANGPDFYYKANGSFIGEHKWSSNMPREAARIFLKITQVTVENLLDISEEDAILEGVERIPGLQSWKHYSPTLSFSKDKLKDGGCPVCKTAKASFFSFWRKLYGASSVELNDLVWVISFDILCIHGNTICKIDDHTCVYHECMGSTGCAKERMLESGTIEQYGVPHCDRKGKSLLKTAIESYRKKQ